MALSRILLTGAAGGIGTVLRPALRDKCIALRSTDVAAITPEGANEETMLCDLRDFSQVRKSMEGIDCVFHLGGTSVEGDWRSVRDINIDGTYNIDEAARQVGVKRVVYASSNHAAGFHRRNRRIGPDEPIRPDSRYGVSKVFGEAIARLYADKHGIESICLRIGQFRPKPTNKRMLSLWLSHADTARLAISCLEASDVHFEIVYGISANTRAWYDNPGAARIGYVPRDDAEAYAATLPSEAYDENDVEAAFQGGPYCSSEFDASLENID
jgi:uronate dehydrogenase